MNMDFFGVSKENPGAEPAEEREQQQMADPEAEASEPQSAASETEEDPYERVTRELVEGTSQEGPSETEKELQRLRQQMEVMQSALAGRIEEAKKAVAGTPEPEAETPGGGDVDFTDPAISGIVAQVMAQADEHPEKVAQLIDAIASIRTQTQLDRALGGIRKEIAALQQSSTQVEEATSRQRELMRGLDRAAGEGDIEKRLVEEYRSNPTGKTALRAWLHKKPFYASNAEAMADGVRALADRVRSADGSANGSASKRRASGAPARSTRQHARQVAEEEASKQEPDYQEEARRRIREAEPPMKKLGGIFAG